MQSTERARRTRRWATAVLAGALGLAATTPGAATTAEQRTFTVVGKATASGIGDGGPAEKAELKGPRMIAFDQSGGFYIADTFHHRIRHVDAAGIITTVAGTGEAGFADGPADRARFHSPHSVSVDAAGNVIVGDPANNRVRLLDPRAKTVTTIAGTGKRSYGGDGGPATAAHLSDSKVALVGPDGHIYVCDYGNSRIRRIRTVRNPWAIETFAGASNPDAGYGDGRNAREAFFKPRNIAFDVDGDLLVADRESNTVRSIAFEPDGRAGVIRTIAGVPGTFGFSGDGGPALEARLFEPRGLGVDWMGNVYIADSSNNRVRRVDAGGVITTVAGTGRQGDGGLGGPATEAALNDPRHIVFDKAGSAFITDTANSRIVQVERFIAPAPAPEPQPPTAPPAPDPGPQVPGPIPPPAPPGAPAGGSAPGSGYWMLDAKGGVHAFGAATDRGGLPAGAVPAVDLEPDPGGAGYWILDERGGVHARGGATSHGSAVASLAPGERATSLSATPSGRGYWVFSDRGRAVAFGDASHWGHMAAARLNGPVVGSVATPSGRGYYMVASDGGIFAFGDAAFAGSMGAVRLNSPVRSLVPDPDGSGYWLVAADGGVFAFDAPFRGSMGNVALNRPVVGMVAFGNGYLMVGEDGGIFNFSDRPFLGSLGDRPPASAVVAVAASR